MPDCAGEEPEIAAETETGPRREDWRGGGWLVVVTAAGAGKKTMIKCGIDLTGGGDGMNGVWS